MNVFEKIRTTCAHAIEVAQDVSINEEVIANVAASLSTSRVAKVVDAFEEHENAAVDFDTSHIVDNVNYRVIFGMLQLGHGFRYELHRTRNGAGASKTITAGLNSLANDTAAGALSSKRLSSLTQSDIQEHFDIRESHITQEPALKLLVEQIHQSLMTTGQTLLDLGCDNMYDWVLKILSESKDSPAADLVLALVTTFPLTLGDITTLRDGSDVWMCKKAILAAFEVHRAVGPVDQRFILKDIDNAPGIIDNVVPAMLVKHGMISLSERLQGMIQSRKALPRGYEEAELRAVGIGVIERLTKATKINASTLSYYFWLIGKEDENRDWIRHHTQDTYFY